jgi:hypothetical protein
MPETASYWQANCLWVVSQLNWQSKAVDAGRFLLVHSYCT